jgi:hypothetical protein
LLVRLTALLPARAREPEATIADEEIVWLLAGGLVDDVRA